MATTWVVSLSCWRDALWAEGCECWLCRRLRASSSRSWMPV